jgi:hypothetical protein
VESESEKTLIILIGSLRGNEKVWSSMYKNLLLPYKADLALCLGYNENKTSSLYFTSKYIWELPEYEDWEEYYIENFGSNGYWKDSFRFASDTGFSGINGTKGSSAITLAFRHYLLKNKKETIEEYDRIILTRTDYFYVREQPILSNDYFWFPSGEGWIYNESDCGSMTDRLHIFPSKDIEKVFGIVDNYLNTPHLVDYFKSKNNYLINIENVYYAYFFRINYLDKVKEFPRTQFLAYSEEDLKKTKWGKTNIPMPYNPDLFIKYPSEFDLCMDTVFKLSYMNFEYE